MALEKVVEVDKIEVVGEYSIEVRQATKVMDDGVQIGGVSYHRHVVHPDHNWSGDDAKVKKIADSLFDADCKEAWQLDQHGYPSGDPSDSWSKEHLQKYCADRSIAMDMEFDSDGNSVTTHTKAELLTKITEYNNPE